jgi:hypothetical protein
MQAYNSSNMCPATATPNMLVVGAAYLATRALQPAPEMKPRPSRAQIVTMITQAQVEASERLLTEPELAPSPGRHAPRRCISISVDSWARQAEFVGLKVSWHGTRSSRDTRLCEIPKFVDGDFLKGLPLAFEQGEETPHLFFGYDRASVTLRCQKMEWDCRYHPQSGEALLTEVDNFLSEHPTGIVLIPPKEMARWMATRELPENFVRFSDLPEPGYWQKLAKDHAASLDLARRAGTVMLIAISLLLIVRHVIIDRD